MKPNLIDPDDRDWQRFREVCILGALVFSIILLIVIVVRLGNF